MAIIMVGNGVAGIASNVSRLTTLLMWPACDAPNNGFKGALAAYTIGVITMISCAFLQLRL